MLRIKGYCLVGQNIAAVGPRTDRSGQFVVYLVGGATITLSFDTDQEAEDYWEAVVHMLAEVHGG